MNQQGCFQGELSMTIHQMIITVVYIQRLLPGQLLCGMCISLIIRLMNAVWPSVFISKGKYVQDEFKERLFQGSYRTRNKPQLFSGTKKAEV